MSLISIYTLHPELIFLQNPTQESKLMKKLYNLILKGL